MKHKIVKKLESSLLKKMNYNKKSKELILTFKNDVNYLYENVEEELIKDFLKAESFGRFFLKNIKGKYDYKKLEKENE